MPDPVTAPFGTWTSPITARQVACAQTTLADVLLDRGEVCWIEGRPMEAGRQVLVRLGPDGKRIDVTPAPCSARTRVHEYGGGAALVSQGSVYFSNFADQRLYRMDGNGPPVALTPPSEGAALRYADGLIDAGRRLWIGIREDHRAPDTEAVNEIVAVSLDGGDAGKVLVHGSDFHASPRLSPDGTKLAWLAWNHPDMPWTAAELWLGEFDGVAVSNATRIAGGPDESVFQPEWSPDGLLHYVSDRSGWWNLYRRDADGTCNNLCPRAAEFGRAQWGFGMSTYAFVSAHELVCTYIEDGVARLARLDSRNGTLTPFDLPYTDFSAVRASGGKVAFKAGGPHVAAAVVVLDAATGAASVAWSAASVTDDPALQGHVSVPRLIEFPTPRGRTAFALFYPPANAGFRGPHGALPPLVVKCHGGPTSSAAKSLDLRTQFWTSRGVAVVDVDYGGSTGYGRAYRERLHRMWGVVDAEDCAAAASYLAASQQVDATRMVITGGSAGGFTALRCLTHEDPAIRACFRAGASHYGVSDLAALARDTHKFESRYLDWLVGPLSDPEPYLDRAPVRHADRLCAPVAFFQGAEDRIVPPSQTELIVAALRARGIPTLYLLFDGEQHGFRQAVNIERALEAEAGFFQAEAFGKDAG
ncbi:Dipeptidyl aminopeptidase/acylaminoacyl peptidase [Variovorax sp. HW608]|uniref:S9 family peptidase n=1 Tax=Variovorax sp. HW608 TaxID=1034889 RepID=UPI00081FB06D|nr:prolyl oligopeptidase family serine peptidase [Variovorax sp. HW608]SCK11684.1 Dipeptidyl aminopeptidase/acylaminoacyl peptidase [Variovorax sp. HW608]